MDLYDVTATFRQGANMKAESDKFYLALKLNFDGLYACRGSVDNTCFAEVWGDTAARRLEIAMKQWRSVDQVVMELSAYRHSRTVPEHLQPKR